MQRKSVQGRGCRFRSKPSLPRSSAYPVQIRHAVIGLLVLISFGCSSTSGGTPPHAENESQSQTTDTAQTGDDDNSVSLQQRDQKTVIVGRADINRSGNRVADGKGSLDRTTPVDIELPGTPLLVLPVIDDQETTRWVVELEDGEKILVDQGGSIDTDFRLDEAADDLVQFEDPLPDGRTVSFGDWRVALVGPTERYPHGVLGDRVEASAIEVRSTSDETVTRFGPDAPTVIEGISPLLADVDVDGIPEILVTQSNAEVGAWLALWSIDGTLIGKSDPIGQGNRWRNQLAIAQLGEAGELEIVDVRTPHIGPTVEFFRLVDRTLEQVAGIGGFTSHTIGSRNLDLGIVADADGDGALEVVLPTVRRTQLGILRRGRLGVQTVAFVDLPGRITTNVAVQANDDAMLAFAVGTDNNMLRIWPAG